MRNFSFIILIKLFFTTYLFGQNPLQVDYITVKGAISPTTASYITRSLDLAQQHNAECLVIELDTPGGLLNSTKEIVQQILASDIPVVVYVAPEGASAASAGTFITLAAHVAVMAPTTNIGAAHPVQMGGGQMDSVMQEKLVNYSESYIETIAKRRNRNIEWAKSAVRKSISITAEEALQINVIDLIAANRRDLLEKLDGREIEGKTLHTQNAEITEIPMSLGERFFSFLFHPEMMLILTLIAIYGILGELSNPGAIFPGVAGVISLVLLLYTVAAVPVNIAGFALIGLAIALFIGEAFTPTFGLLTAGGAVAFILGALMLFKDLSPIYQISWSFLIPITILTVLFFIFIVSAGLRAQFMQVKSGRDTLLHQTVEVIEDIDQKGGRVFVEGESWKAISEQPIKKGDYCEIIEIKGLTLKVKPIK